MPIHVTSATFLAYAGNALEQARLQTVIVEDADPANVVLSHDACERLTARDRPVVRLGDWTSGDVAALEASVMGRIWRR